MRTERLHSDRGVPETCRMLTSFQLTELLVATRLFLPSGGVWRRFLFIVWASSWPCDCEVQRCTAPLLFAHSTELSRPLPLPSGPSLRLLKHDSSPSVDDSL